MCLQPSAWLSKVTQGPLVGQTLRLGATVNFLGLHVSICTVEFSVYYTQPSCTICGATQDTWVIRTLCHQPHYDTVDKVKATTFVLLFGVGSFLCYKIFHHLRRSRNSKSKKSNHLLKELVEAESDISEASVEELRRSSASFGDGESSTDSLSLTNCEEEEEESDVVMGVTSSNPLEPVFFNKSSGIHFQRPYPSPPVDVLGESPQRCSWLEQSTDLSYDGAASLRGNFSPGSLQERTRRTQEFLESSGEEFFSDSQLPQRCDHSVADSVVFFSEKCRPLHRQLSIDCEEMGADLQRKVEAIGRATEQKMEYLDLQLQELKQTVLELDADIVGLKVYRPPPQRIWELTNISTSSDNGSGIVDVIQHHWTKVWCKGLASPQSPQNKAWNDVTRSILDWDYVLEASADSGSDFGNSFETDSVDPESNNSLCGVILEWDHSGLPESLSVDETDMAAIEATSEKKLKTLSKSLSEEGNFRRLSRQHRSMSVPPQMLAQQIKRVIKTPSTVGELASADYGMPFKLVQRHSGGSSGESGFHDLERFQNETSRDEVMKVSSLTWDSAYCEGMEDLADNIGEAISLSNFQSQIGQDETLAQVSDHLDSTNIFSHVRRVKNDGYCILRSAFFLCLSNGIPILRRFGSANAVNDLLIEWSQSSSPWLNEWTFSGKLQQYHGAQGFLHCLSALQKLEQTVSSVADADHRREQLVASINLDPVEDIKVMEALKLLMVVNAMRLKEMGHNAPVFYNLLFARSGPSCLLDKLDRIGSTSLEQADFYLLGYTLSTTLKILRPQRFGQTDFMCHYPECNLGEWPEITLLLMDSDSRCFIPIT